MASDTDLIVDTFLQSCRKMNGREPTPEQVAELRTEVSAIIRKRTGALIGVGVLIGVLVLLVSAYVFASQFVP